MLCVSAFVVRSVVCGVVLLCCCVLYVVCCVLCVVVCGCVWLWCVAHTLKITVFIHSLKSRKVLETSTRSKKP